MDLDVLTLRSGVYRAVLREKSVAVVGLGAVGSFSADLLARSGVGSLRLIDSEVLRPGNVVRHLAGTPQIGMLKVDAVRERVLELGILGPEQIATHGDLVLGPSAARELVALADLVVDASASGPALAALSAALSGTDTQLLSVGLFRDGGLVRIDRLPLSPGEKHLPSIPYAGSASSITLESGCGDPVAPTPPHSVMFAASLVIRYAVRTLASMPTPPSVVEVIEPQADSPYQVEGVIV